MEELIELKKWIELGFESTSTTQSIINKITLLIEKQMEKENEKTKQKLGEWRNDPKNYEAMALPFLSEVELEANTESFYKELAEIRKKYKMTEVIVITKNGVKVESEINYYMAIQQFGDGEKHPELMAQAFKKIKEYIINKLNEAANIKE